MKKPHQKSLFTHVSETITILKQWQYDNNNDKYRKLLNDLTYIHDTYMYKGEEWMIEKMQDLTLWWTGQDEEDFNCLKLLRMKSFGTI